MTTCPKCKQTSGDDWAQCERLCPMPGSPHHSKVEQAYFMRSLDDVLELFADDFARWKQDGDLLELPQFYEALYNHFLPEMPIGIAKARTGDPDRWIQDALESHLIWKDKIAVALPD